MGRASDHVAPPSCDEDTKIFMPAWNATYTSWPLAARMSLSIPRCSGSASAVVQVAPKSSDRRTYSLALLFSMNAAYTVVPVTTIWGSSWRVLVGRSGRGDDQLCPPSEETWSSACGLPQPGQAGSAP